jgi:hypothetical protein
VEEVEGGPAAGAVDCRELLSNSFTLLSFRSVRRCSTRMPTKCLKERPCLGIVEMKGWMRLVDVGRIGNRSRPKRWTRRFPRNLAPAWSHWQPGSSHLPIRPSAHPPKCVITAGSSSVPSFPSCTTVYPLVRSYARYLGLRHASD